MSESNLLTPSLQSYFERLVKESFDLHDVASSDATQTYIINLLCEFIPRPAVGIEQPLGLMLVEAETEQYYRVRLDKERIGWVKKGLPLAERTATEEQDASPELASELVFNTAPMLATQENPHVVRSESVILAVGARASGAPVGPAAGAARPAHTASPTSIKTFVALIVPPRGVGPPPELDGNPYGSPSALRRA